MYMAHPLHYPHGRPPLSSFLPKCTFGRPQTTVARAEIAGLDVDGLASKDFSTVVVVAVVVLF